MDWNDLFSKDKKPTYDEINKFIDNDLWITFNSHLKKIYGIKPYLSYSSCSMQKGWNIKYKKSSKSMCTLYPMSGYFIALVVIGNKEKEKADVLMASCSSYIKKLYNETTTFNNTKWLMININDNEVLEDTLKLIELRMENK